MRLGAQERRLRSAVKHGWSRLISAARPRYRVAAPPHERNFQPINATGTGGAAQPQRAVDLVALTILAVNRLGPATLRGVAHGKPLTVTVPDQRTGEIFRAALAEMQKTRLTDRLIAIVVDDAADARQSPSRS